MIGLVDLLNFLAHEGWRGISLLFVLALLLTALRLSYRITWDWWRHRRWRT